jgi:hypothetical protein
VAGLDVLLEDEVRAGLRAVEKICEIVELLAIRTQRHAFAARAAQSLDDDRQADLTFDQADSHRNRFQNRLSLV